MGGVDLTRHGCWDLGVGADCLRLFASREPAGSIASDKCATRLCVDFSFIFLPIRCAEGSRGQSATATATAAGGSTGLACLVVQASCSPQGVKYGTYLVFCEMCGIRRAASICEHIDLIPATCGHAT